MTHRRACTCLMVLSLVLMPLPARADTPVLRVAVASSMLPALQQLQADFPAARLELIQGATGQLYHQIIAGAPFDVFVAADMITPTRLSTAGKTVSAVVPYYQGTLVLWTPGRAARPEILTSPTLIAHADPALAPYGRAAEETLRTLHPRHDADTRAPQARLIVTASVLQARALAAAGHTQGAFVAASLIPPHTPRSEIWVVPASYYSPIQQGAVSLTAHPAAAALLAFLQSDRAQSVFNGRTVITAMPPPLTHVQEPSSHAAP